MPPLVTAECAGPWLASVMLTGAFVRSASPVALAGRTRQPGAAAWPASRSQVATPLSPVAIFRYACPWPLLAPLAGLVACLASVATAECPCRRPVLAPRAELAARLVLAALVGRTCCRPAAAARLAGWFEAVVVVGSSDWSGPMLMVLARASSAGALDRMASVTPAGHIRRLPAAPSCLAEAAGCTRQRPVAASAYC